MVTETAPVEVEIPVQADPEVPAQETDAPATEVVVVESDAPETEPAAVTQVEITEPEKPDYMTRADWEREKAEVTQRAASDALEADRRKRQTENARKANQEKRDLEDRAELIDSAKAAFGAAGIYEVPDQALTTAVDRMVRKRSEQLAQGSLDTVDAAWDYLTAPAYGKQVELDDSFEPAAKRLGPKVQHLVDAIRPAIEAKAKADAIEEFVKNELPKRVQAEIARLNAKSREGQTPLVRPDGAPAAIDHSSLADRLDRIGTAAETPADRQWWDDREAAKKRR